MRKIYLPVGGALVLVGLLGFVRPNPLLGLFAVSPLHNIIHLGSGALTMLAATQGIGPMRTWGRLLGFVYLVIGIAGFATPDLLGVMRVNLADNLLHVALAGIFLYVGFVAPPR